MDETANGQAGIGFDKMRSMLARAAELRADEQRHLYDMIEDLRVRMAPLETFASEGSGRLPSLHDHVTSVRQRLGELPDRTEMSVIAERLDEALARIDGQDSVLAQVITTMTTLTDRIGRPLDALAARLDGVAGRFEGVSGRLDGLDDRLLHVHGRLDELDAAIARVQGVVEAVPGQLDVPAVHRKVDEATAGVHRRFDEDLGGVHGRLEDLQGRVADLTGRPHAVDPTERLDALAGRLDDLATRLEGVTGRVEAVESSVTGSVGTLSGTVEQGIGRLESAVGERPDRDEVTRTMRGAQSESERRITQQLDHALAAFAEVVLGRGMGLEAKGSAPRAGGRMAGKKSDGPFD